jgi:hypothetical protein
MEMPPVTIDAVQCVCDRHTMDARYDSWDCAKLSPYGEPCIPVHVGEG